jgi:hypothetical protein
VTNFFVMARVVVRLTSEKRVPARERLEHPPVGGVVCVANKEFKTVFLDVWQGKHL